MTLLTDPSVTSIVLGLLKTSTISLSLFQDTQRSQQSRVPSSESSLCSFACLKGTLFLLSEPHSKSLLYVISHNSPRDLGSLLESYAMVMPGLSLHIKRPRHSLSLFSLYLYPALSQIETVMLASKLCQYDGTYWGRWNHWVYLPCPTPSIHVYYNIISVLGFSHIPLVYQRSSLCNLATFIT